MENQNKIYIAILNEGWIRKELFSNLFNWCKESNIPFYLEMPSDRPIESNRNKIVQKFLESDGTYLLMIDNDVVPHKNPLELIKENKDVIILPVPLRQENVTMYNVYDLDIDGYWSPLSKKEGLYEISVGGTGCILIHRRVLQNIIKPFERKYDENGIATLGQDLNFCQKTKEKEFKIYTHFDYICSHFKTIDIVSTI